MSYSGRNFNLLTGVITVAAFTSAVRVATGRDGRKRSQHLVVFRCGLQARTRPGANLVDANGRPV